MTRRYLLDTGIAQDLQAHRGTVGERVIAHRRLGNRVGICVPVLGELWSGVECSASRERNLRSLQHMLATLFIWPYTNEAAEEFGVIFAHLKRTGQLISQVDVQIAAIARTLPTCTIVTKDSDFVAVPGITIENWS